MVCSYPLSIVLNYCNNYFHFRLSCDRINYFNMKRIFQLLWVFIIKVVFVSQIVNAQDLLSLPWPTDTMPEWAKALYEQPVNFIKLEQEYQSYYLNHTFQKNNYTRYYKRLVMLNRMNMDENGYLLESKTKSDIDRRIISKEYSPLNVWKPYNMETYFLENNNKACPWQVNVYRMDVCKANTNYLIASTETGGLFKSMDKGKNWIQVGKQYNLGTDAIAINPKSPDTILVCSEGNIKRSTDGGLTFTTQFVVNGAEFYEIQFHPINSNIILAGSSKGLYRSGDAGKTWNQIFSESVCDIKFHPTKTSTVYCLRYNSTLKQYQFNKSSNSGNSFFPKTVGWTSLEDGGARMATTLANPSRVYVISLSKAKGPQLLRSDDEGEQWTITATGSYSGYDSPMFPMDNWQGYYDLAIVANQKNADEIITGTGSTYKSSDGGRSFKIIGGYGGVFQLHPDLQCAISVNNETWIGTDGGITFSSDFFNDVEKAEARNKGLYGSDFWGFDVGWNEKIVVGGRYHNGNTYWHQNFGDKFIRMGGAESPTGYINPINSRQIFFSDIGAYEMPGDYKANWNWSRIPSSIWPNESYYGMEYSRMIWSPICYNHVYLGKGNKLYKSTNNASSFVELYQTTNIQDWVEFIEISRSNPNVIYFSTRNNALSNGLIYKSTDGGNTFKELNNPPSTSGSQRRVHKMVISDIDDKDIFLALRTGNSSNKVFRSQDGGETWTNLTTTTISNVTISDICYQYGTEGGVYIAADNGRIFYKSDHMPDWQSYGEGLGVNHFTRSLKAFYRDGILVNGSNMGIWEIPFFETSKPVAQPTVDKLQTYCVRDTFYFNDFSVLEYDSLTQWNWEFPNALYISDQHSKNPKVVFGKIGSFDVTLTISNHNGTSSKTINSMVVVLGDECSIDSFTGKCLDLSSNSDRATLKAIPELKNAQGFTCMAWIKLNSKQDCFTQILANWDSDVGIGFGFAFQGYVTTTNLTFFWKNVPYQLTSPFNLELDRWIHVAMVVYPDSVRLYHNGESWTYKGNFKTFNLGDTPWEIGTGVRGQCGNFQGQMDELKIYNRSLSAEEILTNMYLIHPEGEKGLVSYLQFNEINDQEIYNRVGLSHASNGGGTKKYSTAPIGPGVSESIVIQLGNNLFANPSVELELNKLKISNLNWYCYRLESNPDSLPITNGNWNSNYLILKSFVKNSAEMASKLKITNPGIDLNPYVGNARNIKLYRRNLSNEHLNNWEYIADANSVNLAENSIEFFNIGNITGQFIIELLNTTTGVLNDDLKSELFSIFPNPTKSIVYIHLNKSINSTPLIIRNLHGQIINVTIIDGMENIVINTDQWPTGVYIVSISGKNRLLTITE